MRKLKKLASIVLAAVMTLALAVPAFAASNQASITITNPEAGKTYSAYKIFDVAKSGDNVSYTVAEKWLAFVTGEGAGAKYVDLYSANGGAYTEGTAYVQMKNSVTIGETVLDTDVKVMAEFVKEALAYAAENNVNADGTVTTDAELADDATATISELAYGYYAITGGDTMYSLTVDEPTQNVTLKTSKPTVDKTSDKASAQVGETVTFTIKINALPGAVDYVLHDAMGAGLTFRSVTSVTAKVAGTTDNPTTVTTANYTVNTNPDVHEHPDTVAQNCTFTVTFAKAYLDTITEPTEIYVTYTATVNATAVDDGASTLNEAALNYGPNDGWTQWTKNQPEPDPDDPTPEVPEIKTYYFDLVKTNSQNALLDGAQFKLYDAATEGNEIQLTLIEDTTNGNYYRPAVESETVAQAIEVSNGQIKIKGLSAEKTYYLQETAAPAGYNLLTERVAVSLTTLKDTEEQNPDGTQKQITVGTDLKATVTPGTGDELGTWTEGGVQVINLTGAELPETGGMGTTLFYAVGGLLVVGAGVLLIVKKRMGAE